MDNLDSVEKRKVKEMLKEKEKGEKKLDWLYKPNKPDSEEYLLGKRIDKHIEGAEERPREDDVGAIFSDRIKANIALDQAAKMREDPLFAIRRSEESARKRLLENPVKMRQLQLLAKQLYPRKEKKKAKKHKHKHKKDKRQGESSSESDGDDDLVKKYLSILNKKQRRSTDEHGTKYTRTERHSHKKRSSSPEDNDTKRRHIEYESKRKYENDDRTKHRDDSTKHRDDSTKHRDDSTKHRDDSSSKKKHKKHHKDSQMDSESDDNGKKKKFGLSLPKNKSQPIRSRSPKRRKSRSRSPSPKRSLSKSSKPRRDHSPPRKLTAEDREKKLREMMDNAKSHVERREKNVHRYKEEQKREEERHMKHAEDGANFINPLLSRHASQSSVEDRIKRNAYNIQRTKAAMDKHFTKV